MTIYTLFLSFLVLPHALLPPYVYKSLFFYCDPTYLYPRLPKSAQDTMQLIQGCLLYLRVFRYRSLFLFPLVDMFKFLFCLFFSQISYAYHSFPSLISSKPFPSTTLLILLHFSSENSRFPPPINQMWHIKLQ